MFDKLVDLLVQFIHLFFIATVVQQYAGGVILRFGKFHRIVEPGFHWMWPFRIEEALTINVVPETMPVGPQSLTTKDGVSVIISTVTTFRIVDVKTFLLEIEGAGQVIEDAVYGIVAAFVMERTWAELQAIELANELSKIVRRKAKVYGVEIITVQIADWTRSRSLRLMQQVHGHFGPVHPA